jgi:hypothetical protein
MNTKEILQKLQAVFVPKVEETQLSEIEVQVEETIVEAEQVELADAVVKDAVPSQDATVETMEYATKLELEEMKRTFLELLAALQNETVVKQEVPQALSSDVEVELAEEANEIAHSPELEVEKKVDLYKPKAMANESIQSRVMSRLFN